MKYCVVSCRMPETCPFRATGGGGVRAIALLPWRILLLLIVCLGASTSLQAVTLSTSSEGVVIDAAVAGKFTVLAPRLMMRPDDWDGQKAAIAVRDPSHLVAKYPNGAELAISTSDAGKISFSFTQVPAEAHAFRFNTLMPITFGQGGQFCTDDSTWQSFPAQKGKEFLYQGAGSKLSVKAPTGDGFSITTPTGFQELSDNRVYNWPVFCYIFNYIFKEHDNQNTFEFTISPLHAGRARAEGSTSYLIDQFGQLAKQEYSGKVHSEQELKDDAARDEAYLTGLTEPARDSYGGLPGSGERHGLKRTGFFHLGQVGNRQILVTPEGNAFYQIGVCISYDDYTLVRGREKIYQWLPPSSGDFASVWAPQDPTGIISFYQANWVRKYSRPFDLEKWSAQQLVRLRKWGFNSAGAFSTETQAMRDSHFATCPSLPLETWMAPGLKAMQGIDRMYDPFAPGVEEVIDKAFAKQVAPQAANPNIIGYFYGNEQLFENVPKIVPAQGSDSPSKRRLVEMLRQKYGGDIGKFAAAWACKAPANSFDELIATTLFATTPQAAEDMRQFTQLYLETHYSQVARLFRKYDQNHLLLGSRWQPGTASSEMLVKTAAKYVDVISVNYYTYAIDPGFLQRIHEWSGGKPLLMSEWDYTVTDRGMGGQKEVANQKERGLAYRNYVENTAALPFVVGSQWFTNVDEPLTGRWFEGFNGESANTGLVNVVDRPYLDLVSECKKTNDDIYKVIFGEKPPFVFDDPRFALRKPEAGAATTMIPRALPGLKIDGTTQHWPGIPPETITPRGLALGTPDPGFSATFRLCWDEQNLYVIAEVKDKTPMINPHSGVNLWQGDGLEIFIAAEKIGQSGELLPTDRQVLLGASDKPQCFLANSPTQPAAGSVKMALVRSVAGDGYTLEAALPWTHLGIRPAPGMQMLFDIAVDNTDDGKLRNRQWVWNGTELDHCDRGVWGRVRLSN